MANITNLLKLYHRAKSLELYEAEDYLELRRAGALLEILGRYTTLDRILQIADGYITK